MNISSPLGWLYSILPFLIISCSQPKSLIGFDKEIWTGDKFACNEQRIDYVDIIQDNRQNLLQLDQNEVESILGLPDEHELDKRKRKYFYYYLEPGKSCQNGANHPIKLQIRFNALGLSSEVFLENY